MKNFIGSIASFSERAFGSRARNRNPNDRIYESFQAAQEACEGSSYQCVDLVESVVRKNEIFRDSLNSDRTLDLGSWRTIGAISLCSNEDQLNVIDFGGGGGYHYFIAKLFLGKGRKLRWHVVETPAFVDAARRLENEELKFFSNLENAKRELGKAQLVLASSSLQYCPDPLGQLGLLVDVGAEHLCLTRTPLVTGMDKIILVQESMLSSNGPGAFPAGFVDRQIRYPITYLNASDVQKVIEQKYSIRFVVDEGSEAFSLVDQPLRIKGYFCDLSST